MVVDGVGVVGGGMGWVERWREDGVVWRVDVVL